MKPRRKRQLFHLQVDGFEDIEKEMKVLKQMLEEILKKLTTIEMNYRIK